MPDLPDPGDPAGDGDGGDLASGETETALAAATEVQEAEDVRGRDLQSESQTLVAALEARDDIIDAGEDTETDTVWAVTDTGLPINFIRNRFAAWDNYVIEQEDQGNVVQSALADVAPSFHGVTTRDTTELPDGKKAYVMNGMGTCFNNGAAIAQVRSWLSAAGYDVNSSAPTIPNLMSVSDAAVFFINTHGTPAVPVTEVKRNDSGSLTPVQDSERRIGSLWTATPVNRANLTTYKQMLLDEELVVLSAEHNTAADGSCTTPYYFGITPKFIQKYMSFDTDSLVYVQACFSDRDDLANAAFAAGAGVYAGWGALTTGTISYKYYFDRALSGSESGNNIEKETPPQRAFDWQLIYTDLSKKGYHQVLQPISFPWGKVRNDWVNGGQATLVFREAPSGKHGYLLPTIQRLQVSEEQEKLFIHGGFGSRQGKVTIGGSSVSIDNWSEKTISVSLPRSGAGSYGDVVVEVEGRKSNIVPLTEWRGKLTYTEETLGTLKREMEWDLHLRGDVHTYRNEPGGDPTVMTQDLYMSRDSKAKLTASGSHSETDADGNVITTEWSGTQNIPWEPSSTAPQQTVIGEVRPKADGEGYADPGSALLALGMTATAEHTQKGYENGSLEVETKVPMLLFMQAYGFADETILGAIGAVHFKFDSNWNIKADKRTFTEKNFKATLEWEQLTARGTPDRAHARGL